MSKRKKRRRSHLNIIKGVTATNQIIKHQNSNQVVNLFKNNANTLKETNLRRKIFLHLILKARLKNRLAMNLTTIKTTNLGKSKEGKLNKAKKKLNP